MSNHSAHAPILVGVDGSRSAQNGLDWAAAEAAAMQRPLHIVHCVPQPMTEMPLGLSADLAWPRPVLERPPSPRRDRLAERRIQAGERVLAEAENFAQSAAPDAKVTSELVVAAAAPGLLNRAQDAELLVVGSRGLGGFAGLLVGSVSAAVATHAPCPVVVVHPRSEHRPSARQIVVGVDGSEISAAAISYAFQVAARRGVGVTAVLVWSMPLTAHPARMDPVEQVEDSERRLLVRSLEAARARFPDVDVQSKLVRARPSQTLVVESAHADLVVVGSRGRGGLRRLLGSVSQAVLQHAECPVAVVRPHK